MSFPRSFLLLALVGTLVGCHENTAATAMTDNTSTPLSEMPRMTLEEILQQPRIQRGIRTFNASAGHKALAISEEGIWAVRDDMNSLEWASWRALNDCGRLLANKMRNQKTKARGCFLYRLDDQHFDQVTTLSLDEFQASVRKMPEYIIDLGQSTKAAYAKHRVSGKENKAFAVSPGGGWGLSFDFTYPDDAAERAINLCDRAIDLDDAVCGLYSLNGKIIQP